MPPSTATGGPSRRPRPIVPAIPLPLTKPKPKAKSAAIDQASTQENLSNGTSAETNGGDVISQPAVSGNARDESKAFPTSESQRMANGGSEKGALAASAMNGEQETLGDAAISTPTTSTGSSRPSAGRASVRPIRTELPPAFVPSAGQYTPQSATSSSHSRPPAFLPHGHSVRPSASSIVFGALGSHHSSPAPSQSAGSVYTPPQVGQAGAPEPPSSVGVSDGITPASEFAESINHSAFTPAPSSNYHFRQQHGQGPQSSHFRGPSGTQYGGHDFHAPGGAQLPNGHPIDSRAASYGSSVAPDARFNAHAPPYAPSEMGWDAQRADMYDFKGMQNAQIPYRGGLPPFGPPMPSQSHNLHPDAIARQENAEALRDYIHSQFATQALTDCRLQIIKRPEAEPQLLDGHSIILTRSPTLLSLIQEKRQETHQSNITLSIHLSGRYITPRAFMDALRYLYGGPVLQWEQMAANSTSEHLAATSTRMELALQHIAVGAWLKLPAFAARGLEIVSQLLRWDNIDSALRLALEGGLSHIWTIGDGSEEKPGESHHPLSVGSPSPTYDPFSTDLLQRIMAFTTNNFPLNFYLDPTAPELPSCPRLPVIPSQLTDGPSADNITSPVTSHHRSRPSLGGSDPRLSQIRFGDVGPLNAQQGHQQANHHHHPSGTSEDLLHQRHSLPTTATSSILLSLPFPILKCILEHFDLANRLGSDTVASIMRQVIAERETRRMKVLRARGAAESDVEPRAGSKDDSGAGAEPGNISALLSNLEWEEFVQPTPAHRAGFRIARRWIGGGEMAAGAANGAAAVEFGAA